MELPPPPRAALAFHRSVPGYQATRSWRSRNSPRSGACAGSSSGRVRAVRPARVQGAGVFYAVYQVVRDRLGDGRELTDFASLRAAAREIGPPRLVTATDGNHGRAVAHIAALLGLSSRVFVPDVVEASQIHAIREEGRRRHRARELRPHRGTRRAGRRRARGGARPGHGLGRVRGDSPVHRGRVRHHARGDRRPTRCRRDVVGGHPDGVGSLAQAVIAHSKSRGRPVRVLGAEPDTAGCVLESLRAERPVTVATGTTVMAGLNCGTPSSLAWPYLSRGLDASALVTDAQAVAASRQLAAAGSRRALWRGHRARRAHRTGRRGRSRRARPHRRVCRRPAQHRGVQRQRRGSRVSAGVARRRDRVASPSPYRAVPRRAVRHGDGTTRGGATPSAGHQLREVGEQFGHGHRVEFGEGEFGRILGRLPSGGPPGQPYALQ
ncbi:pyridoxal-phosphate dependent enzyme [Streptomyces sp. M19]